MAVNPQSPSPPYAVLCRPTDGTIVPFGFHFHPTDAVMIKEFLMNKALGRTVPFNEIKDAIDVYLHNPKDLPIDSRVGEVECAYFFVIRSKDHGNGVGSHRRTPDGYWLVTESEKAILDEDDEEKSIGFANELVFYEADGIVTEWKMKEYCLKPELYALKYNIYPKMENYVACRIYKKLPKQVYKKLRPLKRKLKQRKTT